MTNKENKLSQGTRVWLRDGNGEMVRGNIRSLNESTGKCSVSSDDGRILRGVHTERVFVEKGADVFDVDGVQLNEGVFSDAAGKVKSFVKGVVNRLKKMVSGKIFVSSKVNEDELVQAVTFGNIAVDIEDGEVPGGVKGYAIEDLVSGQSAGDPNVYNHDISEEDAEAFIRFFEVKAKALSEGKSPKEARVMAEQVMVDSYYNSGLINESELIQHTKIIQEGKTFKQRIREKAINEAGTRMPTKTTEHLDIPNVYGVEGLKRFIIPYCESILRRGNDNIDNDPLWDWGDDRVETPEFELNNIGGDVNDGYRMIPMIFGLPGIAKTAVMGNVRKIIQEWIRENPQLFPKVMYKGKQIERKYGMISVLLSQCTKESLSVLTINDEEVVVDTDDNGFPTRRKKIQIVRSTPTAKFPVYLHTGAEYQDIVDGNNCCNKGSDGAGCGGILFFDELSRASLDVFQACMTFFQDRMIEGLYKLGSQWAMVAAGNRVMDGVVMDHWDAAAYDRLLLMNFYPDVDEIVAYLEECYKKTKRGMSPETASFIQRAKLGDHTAILGVLGDEEEMETDAKWRYAANSMTTDPSKSGKIRPVNPRNLKEYDIWRDAMIQSDVYKDKVNANGAFPDVTLKDIEDGSVSDEVFDKYIMAAKELMNTIRGYDKALETVASLKAKRQFSKDAFIEGLKTKKLIEFFQNSIYVIDAKLRGLELNEESDDKGKVVKKKTYTDAMKDEVTLYRDGNFVMIPPKKVAEVYVKFFDINREYNDKFAYNGPDKTKTIMSFTPLSQYLVDPIVNGLSDNLSKRKSKDKSKQFGSIAEFKLGDSVKTLDASSFGINTSNATNAAYTAVAAILKDNGISFEIDKASLAGSNPLGAVLKSLKDGNTSNGGMMSYTKIESKGKKIKDLTDVITPLQWFNLSVLAGSMSNVLASEFIESVIKALCIVCLDLGIAPSGRVKLEETKFIGYIDVRWVTEALFCVDIQPSEDDDKLTSAKKSGRSKEIPDHDDNRTNFGVENGYLAGAIICNGIFGSTIDSGGKFMGMLTDEVVVSEVYNTLVVTNAMSKE